MRFSEVVGHSETKKKLIQSVKDGRIPHAQLFLGHEGSGNLALAMAYVQYINCTARAAEDSCGTCASCLKTEKMSHPDVHFAFPVVGSDETSETRMDEFREAILSNPYATYQDWIFRISEGKNGIINIKQSNEIIRKLALKPYEGHYQFMIIWMPEKMNAASANKLLKTIEEPPQKTAIILVANNEERILNTILSRMQTVKLKKISDFDMLDALSNRYGLDLEKGRDIVNIADGDYNIAQRLAELEDYKNDNSLVFMDWMRACFKKDMKALVKFADDMGTQSRDAQKAFYIYSLHMIRESVAFGAEPSVIRVTEDEKEFVKNFSKYMKLNVAPQIAEKLEQSIYHVERNAHAKITFMNLSLSIAGLMGAKNQ